MLKRDLLAAVVAVEPACRGRDLGGKLAVEGQGERAARGWPDGLPEDSGCGLMPAKGASGGSRVEPGGAHGIDGEQAVPA